MNATRQVTMVLKKTFLNFAQMLAMECLSTIPITVRKVEVTDRQSDTLGLTKKTTGNGKNNLKLIVKKNTQKKKRLGEKKKVLHKIINLVRVKNWQGYNFIGIR